MTFNTFWKRRIDQRRALLRWTQPQHTIGDVEHWMIKAYKVVDMASGIEGLTLSLMPPERACDFRPAALPQEVVFTDYVLHTLNTQVACVECFARWSAHCRRAHSVFSV